MTDQNDPMSIEQTITIDAPVADLYAYLTEPKMIPEYSPTTAVTSAEESVRLHVSVVVPGDGSPLSLPITVCMAERTESTHLVMTVDGAIDGQIEWLLQPHEENTLVSVTVSYTLNTPDFREIVAAGDYERDETRAAVIATVTEITKRFLPTLKQLCERQPPHPVMVNRELPEITSPFTAEISPHLDVVTAHAQDWVVEMGLFPEREIPRWVLEVPRATCRVHPQASFEALCLCNDWYSWGFLYDDRLDDTEMGAHPAAMKTFQQPLLSVFEKTDTSQHDKPLVRALDSIWQRAMERMSKEWQNRFSQHHVDFFTAQQWEAHNRAYSQVPQYDTYIEKQRDAAAAAIPFALGELAEDIDLPSSVYNEDTVTVLREAAANVFAWTNDFYSLRKELLHKEVNNLVVVVRAEQNCSLQDAVTETGVMLNNEIRRFADRSQQFTAKSDTDELRSVYQTALERVVQGHLTWCQETVRYKTSSS